MKTFKNLGKIGLRVILNASQRGKGVALYLDKKICETFGIRAGDRVEVELLDLYKEELKREEA